jgi:uncharacterized Zn finger protein
MYEVKVTVTPVPRACWSGICTDCAGAIDSLVELLQGRFSKAVMARVCQQKTGLFPSPGDIRFTCNCPDRASMCKHVAAVLYGIGARLDQQPELLFTLRQVDQQDLIANAGADLAKRRPRPAAARMLASDDLSEMFGIEIVASPPPDAAVPSGAGTKRATSRSKPAASPERAPASAKPPAAGRKRRGKQRLSPAGRQAISERMRMYWAARRELVKKSTSSAKSS